MLNLTAIEDLKHTEEICRIRDFRLRYNQYQQKAARGSLWLSRFGPSDVFTIVDVICAALFVMAPKPASTEVDLNDDVMYQCLEIYSTVFTRASSSYVR